MITHQTIAEKKLVLVTHVRLKRNILFYNSCTTLRFDLSHIQIQQEKNSKYFSILLVKILKRFQ